ncbi:molybdopterin molybdotransferase MoeA [Labilibaculum euxinus]|uniref:Molybdopterin molybdenumtransferase n=1 Tax=Labilibaculum euxinus TaxID=2686357 RepID=A0A7M4D241_9BACT|nr:gephyrin-like molybdotransferase Glp [Labilibaculum euxinus]MUP36720.1 molybdopterin molybdenumtransferase MoeA [Labilibaculum euxinus]MVB05925.1 molybdopterin molybdenumtransferase MoeA [Labilibaculum euxinus]
MITFHEALKTVKNATKKLDTETINLADCLNRVLAEDVLSDMSIPPFNKSAMDGYACKQSDLANNLEVLEIIAAGSAPSKAVGNNQCSKIMTGAMVPEGADTVIMIEHTEEIDDNHIRFTKDKTKSNICLKGEDILENDVVLKRGTRLKAQHISVLASVGCANPLVFRQPKVATIATGSELVEPDQKPEISQIRNVNSWQLQAQLQKMGIRGNSLGIVADSKEATKEAMVKCLEENDVLIISGGVSVGDFDYIPQILKELGFNIWFHTLMVKPGKHTVFATCREKYVLGLPGNPVSSFVQFELLGKPLLYRLMGHDYNAPMVRMPIASDYKRKRTDRLEFLPVRFNADNQVVPISYHGSAHINAFTLANGIMAVPREVDEFTEGEFVHVRQL